MGLELTGTAANTWVSLDDANLIIIDIPASLYGYEPADPGDTFQFDPDDISYLLEAAVQISKNWSYRGRKVDPRQRLAWPRLGFMIDNSLGGASWFKDTFPILPAEDEAFARFLHFDAPGLSRYTELASDEIPVDVKEAQVILAALLKNGGDLFSDNKGDATTYGLGSISGDNINAVAVAQAVFQRMSAWGQFIGGSINKAGGSRG